MRTINYSKEGIIYFSNARKLKSCIKLSCAGHDLLTRGYNLTFTLSSQSTYSRTKSIKKNDVSYVEITEVVSCTPMESYIEYDHGSNDMKISS